MTELLRRELAEVKSAAFGWEMKLRKTDDFSSVFRFKRVQRGHYLDMHVRPNDLGYPRLGLITSKKILARAVDRNQLKRLLREAFRLRQDDLGGVDVIFRVKARADSHSYRTECEYMLTVARTLLTKLTRKSLRTGEARQNIGSSEHPAAPIPEQTTS